MKVGYIHYDGGSGTNLPYTKGTGKSVPFMSHFMREGGPSSILHIFGADSIPIDANFDYRQVDVDLVYFWIQGGIGPELPALRKFRKEVDAVFVLFFDDVYWLKERDVQYYLNLWRPVTNLMDVLTSGYLNDGDRVSPILQKPWRYLPYPHDVQYYKQFFKKDKERAFFSMIHGRKTVYNRTMLMYKMLHNIYPDWRFIIHPYRFYTKEQVLQRYPFDWLEFTPVVDDWFELLGRQAVQIDEYPCLSQSQVVTQAACVGTPTIGHKYNAPIQICFPKLTFPLDDIWRWLRGAKQLIEDQSFYDEVQKHAFDAVEDYNFDNFRKRMIKIYKENKR